jgi:hypothetical protein
MLCAHRERVQLLEREAFDVSRLNKLRNPDEV